MFGFFKKKPRSAPIVHPLPPEPPPAQEPGKPDLATIDSRDKAEAHYRAGSLDKLLMRPLELGGEDHPLNTLYVPKGIVHRKSDIDLKVIAPLIKQGKITQYSAKAEYQGTSVIPNAITITVSEPESYIFNINIWGDAKVREERKWDEVYAAREAIYAKHFGVIDGDVQKLMNLMGVWPGGCLVQVESPKNQIWVTSSFGLTNADMPTSARSEEYKVEEQDDGNVSYQSRLAGRPPRAIPAGWAGYGYELLVLTRQKESWPLMLLNWAVPMEILKDVDILGRVHQYDGLTIEGITLGDGRVSDFLFAPLQQFAPAKTELPNGSMEFLVATTITREEMSFALAHGRKALIDRIKSRPSGQISE